MDDLKRWAEEVAGGGRPTKATSAAALSALVSAGVLEGDAAPPPPAPDDTVGRCFAAWVAACGLVGVEAKATTAVGRRRTGAIRARLGEGYSEADFAAVLDAVQRAPWWRERRMVRRLETWCRPTHFAGLLDWWRADSVEQRSPSGGPMAQRYGRGGQ